MIDTAPRINRSTNRLTTGEGHVARHGDVRRVRKVFVGCPATRPLRGQPPAQKSPRRMHSSFRAPSSFRRRPEPRAKQTPSFPRTRESRVKQTSPLKHRRSPEPTRQPRRSETVRNRLTRKPPTKPLPPPTAEAQTQEPRNRKQKERGPKPPIKRAQPRHSRARGNPEKSNPCRIERRRRSPLSRWAGEGRGEGNRGGQTGGGPQQPATQPKTNPPTTQQQNPKNPRSDKQPKPILPPPSHPNPKSDILSHSRSQDQDRRTNSCI